MSNWKNRKLLYILALTIGLTLALTSIAFADIVTSDVDVVTGNQTFKDLGNVSPDQTVSTSTSFQLVCAGKNHADENDIVTVYKNSATIPPGGALTAGDAIFDPIPADWADDTSGGGSTNCANPAPVLNDNGNSAVSITAPTTAGTYDFVIQYKVATSGGVDPNDVTAAIPDVTFRLTVVTDTTPPVIAPHGDVTAEATSAAGAIVSYTSPATSDNVDSPGTATCAPASGSQFALRNTTVTCNATDAAGNDATPTTFVVHVVDTTAPVIAAHADIGPIEATSPGGATVTYTAPTTSDAVDDPGTATCLPASGGTFALGDTTVTCNATDAAGNTATPTTFKVTVVDTTPPTITFASRLPAANGFGWNNSDVTVKWSCSDLVGVVIPFVTVTVSTEGANQSAKGTCEDTSGNKASDTQIGINIDKTKPIISGSRLPLANSFGWNNTDVVVSFSCAEAGLVQSGLDTNTVAGTTVSTEGQNQSVTNTGTCTDKAGNTADSATVGGISIDKTLPIITGSRLPLANSFGWNNTDVTVSFTCAEVGLVQSGLDTNTVAGVTLSDEGENQSVTNTGTCTDKAGNIADAASVAGINIDKTKPVITGSRLPLANSFGWNNTDVVVSFSCSEAGSVQSGLDTNTVAGATVSTEGAGQSVTNTGACTDKAGNTAESASVGGINIDKTAPTLTWSSDDPADGGVYYFYFVPTEPYCTANDGLSGPNGCTVTGYSAAIGSHTLTATAYDKAGNSKVETRSYTVNAWTLKGFFPPVDMDGVVNVVKGGSTVPLKFKIFAGTTELTDISYISSFTYAANYCSSIATEDNIETLATGGTVLRYTDGQFIFNWKTPKNIGCYRVTMTTLDGSSLVALFRLK